MSFDDFPPEDKKTAHSLYSLYRNSQAYKDAFRTFARKFVGNTELINILLLRMPFYQPIDEDLELIGFLIRECGATALNEFSTIVSNVEAIINLVKYHKLNNFNEIIHHRPVTRYKKEHILHICLIEHGARITLYSQNNLKRLLENPFSGIILNLHPSLLAMPVAKKFVVRHEYIKKVLSNMCLNYISCLIMEYVVYEFF
jgi:hypothetical protein